MKMEEFGKFCFGVLILTLSIIIGGFVMMQLWNWLIAKTFPLQSLTLMHAIGVSVFVAYLKPAQKSTKDKDFIKTTSEGFARSIFIALAFLLIGYLTSLCF